MTTSPSPELLQHFGQAFCSAQLALPMTIYKLLQSAAKQLMRNSMQFLNQCL